MATEDGLREGFGQPPSLSEPGADFGMTGSKLLAFEAFEPEVIVFGVADDFVVSGDGGVEGEHADVLQKAGEEGLLRVDAQLLRKGPSRYGVQEPPAPVLGEVEGPPRGTLTDERKTQAQSGDGARAQRKGRAANRRQRGSAPKRRRIGDAHHLGRQRRVARQKVRYSIDVDVGTPALAEEFDGDAGKTRQIGSRFEQLLELGCH